MLPMISLIGVTAVWGSTFFMIKGLLNEISALDFLSVRFILASVVSAIVMFPRLRGAKRQTWIEVPQVLFRLRRWENLDYGEEI